MPSSTVDVQNHVGEEQRHDQRLMNAQACPIQEDGFEGIAYCAAYGTELLPWQDTLVEESSSKEGRGETIASNKLNGPITQQDANTVTFVMEIERQTALSSISASTTVKVPLANTLFTTGEIYTMFVTQWRKHKSSSTFEKTLHQRVQHQDVHLPLRKASYTLEQLTSQSRDQSSQAEGPSLTIKLPLVALTPPRKITTSMENIIRQLEDGPASLELEAAVSAYFEQSNMAPEAASVWALVLPKRLVEHHSAHATLAMAAADGELSRMTINVNGRVREVFSNAPSSLLLRGARLHKVTSGGGGWGNKAGLLSLDKDVDFIPASDRYSDDAASILDLDTFVDESDLVIDVTSPGDYVRFYISPNPDYESLFEPNDSSSPLEFERETLEFGVLPESFNEYDMPPPTQAELDGPNIKALSNHFGVMSEVGLSFAQSADAVRVQTKIDVPYARISYQNSVRSTDAAKAITADEAIFSQISNPKSTSKHGKQEANVDCLENTQAERPKIRTVYSTCESGSETRGDRPHVKFHAVAEAGPVAKHWKPTPDGSGKIVLLECDGAQSNMELTPDHAQSRFLAARHSSVPLEPTITFHKSQPVIGPSASIISIPKTRQVDLDTFLKKWDVRAYSIFAGRALQRRMSSTAINPKGTRKQSSNATSKQISKQAEMIFATGHTLSYRSAVMRSTLLTVRIDAIRHEIRAKNGYRVPLPSTSLNDAGSLSREQRLQPMYGMSIPTASKIDRSAQHADAGGFTITKLPARGRAFRDVRTLPARESNKEPDLIKFHDVRAKEIISNTTGSSNTLASSQYSAPPISRDPASHRAGNLVKIRRYDPKEKVNAAGTAEILAFARHKVNEGTLVRRHAVEKPSQPKLEAREIAMAMHNASHQGNDPAPSSKGLAESPEAKIDKRVLYKAINSKPDLRTQHSVLDNHTEPQKPARRVAKQRVSRPAFRLTGHARVRKYVNEPSDSDASLPAHAFQESFVQIDSNEIPTSRRINRRLRRLDKSSIEYSRSNPTTTLQEPQRRLIRKRPQTVVRSVRSTARRRREISYIPSTPRLPRRKLTRADLLKSRQVRRVTYPTQPIRQTLSTPSPSPSPSRLDRARRLAQFSAQASQRRLANNISAAQKAEEARLVELRKDFEAMKKYGSRWKEEREFEKREEKRRKRGEMAVADMTPWGTAGEGKKMSGKEAQEIFDEVMNFDPEKWKF